MFTTYTYDAANQLDTAQQGSTTWNYTYDANGSLLSDGVKTYTYDSANRLIQVSEQSSVTSLAYNGLGQRLSMNAAGVIAHYVLDGDLPLTAQSGSNTTFYLYGRGPIGEKTNTWNYSLLDGTNTPRQLTAINGDVTLSTRYTPWGNTLELNGTGNFTFGYIGGILDAATGLLYVGNGQYYDPATGRFLTRGVNPDSPNPYVPWNPIGAILGPLGVLSLVASRRRGKRNKNEPYLFLFIMLVVLPLSVGLACGGSTLGQSTATQPVQLSATELPPATAANITPTATQSPTDPLTDPACCATETPTPTGTPTPMPSLNRDELKRPGAPNADKAYDLYLTMYKADKTDSKNWWWKGESDFTIWKFMAILWGYDAVLDLPLVRDAMHNRAKAFCPGDPPCDPQTPEGSLRYLTVFAQSGRDRIKAWQPGTDPLAVLDYEPNIQAGTHIVDAIKTSDVDNVNNLDAMAPFDYGNISLNPLYSKMVSEGWVLLSIPATSGNTFFVLSKCQYYFAQAVINPKEGNKPLEPTQTNYNLYCK